MARPATRTRDLVSVSVDGRGAAWCDGFWSGDAEIIEDARLAATYRAAVPINGLKFEAHGEDALGALIALHAHLPGRTIVVESTPEFGALLAERAASDAPETWSAA
ncbi:hypothetical protein GCM10025867_48600 (plasmid) [Frondihabitans sucicola]|uniref:Uncharacterized protein n=1 Tax=Frondihabitans sucicola TaxID=1268041 RepID=A0ABM8GVW4_9MICO|nr:hypothetical protein [Frondihabitans sucicola]BDZ52619.1 hypothetical protein GCM10025867_48600 [Frondihabitans sucicola]